MNAAARVPSGESAQRAWIRALEVTARATRDPRRTLPHAIAEWARLHERRTALIGDEESFSYPQLDARLNQYARWGLAQDRKKGAAVALMMRNRPEYAAIWLGLTRIGAVVALISPDARGPALAHALATSESQMAVASAECALAMRDAGYRGPIWTVGPGELRLDETVALYSGAPLATGDAPDVRLDDNALRIFTSGTTGLPKAAEVSHRKIVSWTHWFSGLAGLSPEIRLYNCLPMHHSVGGVVAVGAALVEGGATAIARKFSVHRFWEDIARWDCNAFQYIGELCRYLTAAPPTAEERGGRLQLALGNGLAPEVWGAFAQRFPQTRVLEFYASTEGNVWLYNVEGRKGALGRVPPFLAAKSPMALVRFDEDAQAPFRGADGFCVACGDNEAGEALGRIAGDAASRFEGYSDAAETEKKVLRNVFAYGDAWMRTGDLMRRDGDGFFHFVDRVGDTFRWKGENVSTAEVAAVLRDCPGVVDALVYGVRVPGAEGRAGMAALEGSFQLSELEKRLEGLPRWARPVFLRLAPEIARTETFKPKRALYALEGFDPAKSSDRLFVHLDGAYRPMTEGVFRKIESGALRL